MESFNGNFLYSVLISVPVLHGGGHIAGDFAESLRRFKAYGQKTLKSQPFKRKACENQLEKSGCTVWVFRLRNARSPKHSASTLRKPDGAVPQFAFG